MPSAPSPIAFSLFGVEVRWYALFIMTGIFVAVFVSRWIARRRGLDPDFMLDVIVWAVGAGIIGARLYYVLLKWSYFSEHPSEIINVREGGLTIHGALIAGVTVFVLYARRYRQPEWAWADIAIAVVPIGQAIGRWGNWANQEAFGRPTDLPWGLAIDPERRPAEYASSTHFHPTFLYESVLDFFLAGFLVWLVLRMPTSRRLREGDIIAIYMVVYGFIRLAVESLRTDSLFIGPLPAAYWLSGALVAGGALLFILRRTLWPGRTGVESQEMIEAMPVASA